MRALTLAHGLRMPPPRHTTRWRLAAAPPPQPVPVKALVLSVLGHVVIVAALVGLALLGVWDRPTVHVVNLVSTIAAVGNPAGSPASLPSRVVTPRAGERDLPPLAPPSDRRGKVATEPVSRPPATPLGQVTGSISGQGSLTLDVTDFPYAWYLRQVLQKVEEHWQTQNRSSEPAQKPRIYVEIRRDGSIAPPRVEESSGSSFYDRAALRAITEASPFPPLPADWANPSLRVLFNFDLKRG